MDSLRQAKGWLENKRRHGLEVLTVGQRAIYHAVEHEAAKAAGKLADLDAAKQQISRLEADLGKTGKAVDALYAAYELMPSE